MFATCSDEAPSGGGNGSNGSSGSNPAANPAGDGVGNAVEAGLVTSTPANYTCTREIHVSATGNDANNGSATSPLRTIAKSTLATQPGDCVKVHAGTYAESTTIAFRKDGSEAAPIVLWSVDGRGAAIIDAGGNRTGPTVLMSQNHVIIDGFEFKNSPTDTNEQVVHFDGLKSGKGVGSVLRNCKITGGYDHIKLNQASDGITVENNEFYGKFGHLPISLTGANRLVFRGNFCHDWNTGPNGAVQIKGGSRDAIFDGNRFQDIVSAAGAIA